MLLLLLRKDKICGLDSSNFFDRDGTARDIHFCLCERESSQGCQRMGCGMVVVEQSLFSRMMRHVKSYAMVVRLKSSALLDVCTSRWHLFAIVVNSYNSTSNEFTHVA